MASSLQTLVKILRLEQQKEYQNKAVIGGLGRFAYHWAREAHGQAGADDEHALVDTIAGMLRDYDDRPQNERPTAIEEIIALAQSRPFQAQAQDKAQAKPHPHKSREAAQVAEDSAADQDDLFSASQQPARDTAYSQPSGGQAVVVAPVSVRERRGYALQEPAFMADDLRKRLNAHVSTIRGVGEARAKQLDKIGAKTIGELLMGVFPRRYDDYSQMKLIRQLKTGEEVTVIGTLARIQAIRAKQGAVRIEAYVEDESGALRLNWFNQPWLEKQLKDGAPVVVSGKIEQYLGRLVMNAPEIEPLESEWLQAGRIVPVYPLTKGLPGRFVRRLMKHVVDTFAGRLPEFLPASVREDADLMDYGDAVAQAHFPDSQEDLAAAQHRLAFDELFGLNLQMLRQRHLWQRKRTLSLSVDESWVQAFAAYLPYELTGAQQRAIADIRADMANEIPMNRLLQGDVGSGKTMVAAAALGIAISNGAQAVFMAPTSILAEQHYANLSSIFGSGALGEGLSVALLTGNTSQADRAAIYQGLADGSIHLVIGTHAVIQPDVAFAKLGLAVIDEQHRFGVLQRAALREKAAGGNPHLLVMTATPIPRTLALTIHADLDLTVIDEMPPGRHEVQTRIIQPNERERVYAFVRSQIQKGHQAFIIYPLVEESDKLAARAAVAEHKRLQEVIFPDCRLGLLHGRMKPDEKEAVMDAFHRGETQVLVSTSVIEVGIDVPNATVMFIENANRFGLAQLHQLRGRVGRGGFESFCLLMSDKIALDDDERLRALEETTDGFRLAQIDWELRGAGDLIGVRQSGFNRFQHADLMDSRLVDVVQREARAVYEADPELKLPEHQPLIEKLRPRKHEGDVS